MPTENTVKPARGRYAIFYWYNEVHCEYKPTFEEISAVLRSGDLISVIGSRIHAKSIIKIVKYESYRALQLALEEYPVLNQSEYEEFIKCN